MRDLKGEIKSLSLMLSMPILSVLYPILNSRQKEVYSLVSSIDRGIPFVKAFVLPYLGFYPFIFLTLLYIFYKDKETYYKALITINLGLLASFFVYYFFQTTVPRPVFIGDDFLSTLVQFVYKSDGPYNAFPSIHVLLSYLMFKFISKCSSKGKLSFSIVSIMSILVIASTQFIKQHVILDMIGAFILGEVLVMYVFDLEYLKVDQIGKRLIYAVSNSNRKEEEKTTFLAQ